MQVEDALGAEARDSVEPLFDTPIHDEGDALTHRANPVSTIRNLRDRRHPNVLQAGDDFHLPSVADHQPAVRPDEHPPVAVAVERRHRVGRKAIGHGVRCEGGPVEVRQSVTSRSDPDRAVSGFGER